MLQIFLFSHAKIVTIICKYHFYDSFSYFKLFIFQLTIFSQLHKQAFHNVLAEVFVGYSIIDCTPRIRFLATTALVFNYIFTLAAFQFITKLFRTLIFMVKIGIAIRISLRVRPNFDLPSPSPRKESENLSKSRHVP